MKFLLSALAAVTAAANMCALAQDSGVVRVLSSNGVRVVLEEMQPQIEQSIGRRLAFEFSTSRTLTNRIEAGEAFDVAILTPRLIDELISLQKVTPGSSNEFARVGIGVGSPTGSACQERRHSGGPPTDISRGGISCLRFGRSEPTNQRSKLRGPGHRR